MSISMSRQELFELVRRNDLAYNSQELAKKLNTRVEMINLLRIKKALKGIKVGKGYIYPYHQVEQFLEKFSGCDLSNAEMIEIAVVRVNQKRKE